MLRDFGLVTVLDLGVALIGVLLVSAGGARLGGDRVRPPRLAAAAPSRRPPGSRRGMSDDQKARPDSRRPSSRYSIFVGIAFVILIVVATVNTLRNRDDGILGTGQTDRGDAAAGVRASRTCAATRRPTRTSSRTTATPPPTRARPTIAAPPPARSTSPGAIRVCDLFDRPLVISFWFTRGADCLPTQDVVDDVSRRFRGRVNFLSIDVRDDHDDAQRHRQRARLDDARSDGTRDGAVSNLYRVGVCPTVAFAYPGGDLQRGEARAATSSPRTS